MRTDPRIAELYDLDNPGGFDHEHVRDVADRLDAGRIVDLGCGTGLLTVSLAVGDRVVTGIDPDEGMLDIARRRPGGDRVRWVVGASGAIGDARADLVLMTGNVVQHVSPATWERTLADCAAGLRVGGVVLFDTRNPSVEAWRSWTPERTRSSRDTPSGRLTEWLDTTPPDEHGTVVMAAHNVWEATGEHVVVHDRLTFRRFDEVADGLRDAGLSIVSVAGGWRGEPFSEASPLLVVEAVRSPA